VTRRKLFQRLQRGSLSNVPFPDFRNLMRGFGFGLVRVTGSHFLYAHPGVTELINLQEKDGEAKPYQIRQFLQIVERYNLAMEDDE
jgi:predicted RNA binding protein YcfA (HicA-like mRNA interferase family)